MQGGGGGLAPADYIITSDAEWTTVFANDDATLSGKIIEATGVFTAKTLSQRSFTTAPILRAGSGGAEFPNLVIDRVTNLTFQGITIQHRNWPATAPLCNFGTTGASSGITFRGATFRHGYGPDQEDFDTSFDYSEYTRVDNIGTATTTSAATALTWQDAAATNGRIFVFNNGSSTIYAKAGDGSVVATTGDLAIASGAYETISVDPTTTSHIAVLASSGSQDFNARTEIGMAYYLADAFNVGGGSAACSDLWLIGCHFEGVSNAVKGGNLHGGQHVIMDCTGRAIYQDVLSMSVPAAADSTTWLLRNTFQRPFARSGIAQDLDGDANDPHGDLFQKFGTTNATHTVISAGNTFWTGAMRTGIGGQGHFWQGTVTHNSVVVGDILSVGQTNGVLIQNAESCYLHGITCFDPIDPTSSSTGSLYFGNVSGTQNYIGSALARQITLGADVVNGGTYVVPSDPSVIFDGWADRFTAITRGAVESAFTTIGAAAGLGAVAVRDAGAINWTTTDHTAVINWAACPVGVDWVALENQDLDTVVSTPLRRVLNRTASMPVVPSSGIEWRSVDTDGTTEVQGWTSASGTIEPLQYIQIRGTTASTEETTTQFGVTIMGEAIYVDVTTRILGSSYFVGQTVAEFDGQTGAQTISLTGLTNGLASEPAEGDLVIVSIAIAAAADRRSSMGVNTAGYTEVAELFSNSTRDANLGVYYKVMGATPDTSVEAAVSSSSSDPKIVTVQVFRGFDTTTPLDVASTTSTDVGTTKPDPAAITPSTAGSLIVIAAMSSTGDGTTPAPSALLSASYLGDVSSTANQHASQPRAVSSIMGSVEWAGGTYNPDQMSCATGDTGNSVAAVTMALRPAP